MRVSRAQAEANRERVIDVASRLFREHGFDGIGLKDLMKGAGLTQGGFYKQFESKDDLAALASQRALDSSTRRWSDATADASDPLESIISLYLSKDHCGEQAEGCPLVSLGSDAARQTPQVRRPFEDGIRERFERLAEFIGEGDGLARSEKAMAIWSMMVGAVTLSKIIEDEHLSTSVLDAASNEVRRIAGRDSTR
ncbi:TetR/AcrR family transcriptional regulator [Agrobacterium larrymoorei]|uniref:TetR/AcrR family transcriptional regulator n=1 Tax=Agrobacterium larrymoorei TaxID=160699 RepID=UPI0015749EDA|nr:TetR/AcrR family transcriptional regulator [Agrobacterium larrymoorei]NTJ44737.1 TetR/AcrR family transcriptional regulator [Agrobacterium larrymoorei]